MRDAGVKVGLGVDGSASNDAGNLVLEARQSMLLQRVANGADVMSAREALEIATRGGAQVLGRDDCGQISVGKRADIAIWDVGDVQSAGSWDPAALLLAGPVGVRDLFVEWLTKRGGSIRDDEFDTRLNPKWTRPEDFSTACQLN
jgi:cytosine/adenosine deaminase-related metal-dependent hydrolase